MNGEKKSIILDNDEYQQMLEYGIDIRGIRDRDNIYFNMVDAQNTFKIPFNTINHTQNIIWISVKNKKQRYLTYNDLIKQSDYSTDNHLLKEYISWVDQLIDNDELSDWSAMSIDSDNSTVACDCSDEINNFMISAYQHKIDLLAQIIETKNREIDIKDKDIEIITLKHDQIIREKNKHIEDLINQIESINLQSEWI
jgi:hypothetical protein